MSIEQTVAEWQIRAGKGSDVWFRVSEQIAARVSAEEGPEMVRAMYAGPAPAPGRVYLVNTGEIGNGLELYERHETPPPLSEFETLYTREEPQRG